MSLWTVWQTIAVVLLANKLECKEIECEHDWTPPVNNNKSYLLCRSPLAWYDARQKCQDLQGDLVIIQDVLEKIWLDNVTHSSNNPRDSWWIGIDDRDLEDTWKWVNGHPLDTAAIKWDEGEPNNGKYGKDCAEFIRSSRSLNPIPCNEVRCFICYDDNTGLKMPVPFSYESFEFFTSKSTWIEAYNTCRRKSWSLLQIHNATDKYIVGYFLIRGKENEGKCSSWWLGIEKVGFDWKWLNKDVLDTDAIPWDVHTSHVDNEEDCGMMKGGYLSDQQCSQKCPFICEKEYYSYSTDITEMLLDEELDTVVIEEATVTFLDIIRDNYVIMILSAVSIFLLLLLGCLFRTLFLVWRNRRAFIRDNFHTRRLLSGTTGP